MHATAIPETLPRNTTHSAASAALTLALLAGIAQIAIVQVAAAAEPGEHCRFYSAEEMSKLLGKKMRITLDTPLQCLYRDETNKANIQVKVRKSGYEEITMAEARKTQKVPGAAGEAYYDPDLFGFAARVGQYNVSVQADYRPAPDKELIAIGTRITKALAGK